MLPKKRNLEMVKGDTLAFPLKIKSIDESDLIFLDAVEFVCFTNYGGNEIFRKGLYNGIDKPSTQTIEVKGAYIYHIVAQQQGMMLVYYTFEFMDPDIGPVRPGVINTYDTYRIVNDVPIPSIPSTFTVLNEDILIPYTANTYFKWNGEKYEGNIEEQPHESIYYIVEPPSDDYTTYLIKVFPEDTKDDKPGEYYYELRIRVNGDVFTLMHGAFIIRPEATKE